LLVARPFSSLPPIGSPRLQETQLLYLRFHEFDQRPCRHRGIQVWRGDHEQLAAPGQRHRGADHQRAPESIADLPTIAEAGYPRCEASTWFGIAVPKKTPSDVAATLNAAINRILEDKLFRDQFEGLGLVVHMPHKPNEALDFMHRDCEKWGAVVKAKQITSSGEPAANLHRLSFRHQIFTTPGNRPRLRKAA
jgi:hypothetical protein